MIVLTILVETNTILYCGRNTEILYRNGNFWRISVKTTFVTSGQKRPFFHPENGSQWALFHPCETLLCHYGEGHFSPRKSTFAWRNILLFQTYSKKGLFLHAYAWRNTLFPNWGQNFDVQMVLFDLNTTCFSLKVVKF